MRRLLPHAGVVFVLLAVLLAVSASPAAAAGWTSYDRPAQYGVVEEANVPITMSDGVVLNALVHRPDAPGRFPVVVVDHALQRRQRHHRRRERLLSWSAATSKRSSTFAAPADPPGTWDVLGPRESGTATSRGVGGSAGVERRQGRHVRRLLRGDHADLPAAPRPPLLKAIFPILPMGDGYRDMVFPGGQNNVGFIPFWLVLVSGSALIPPSYALSGDPDDLARGLETLASHALAFPGFDLQFELDAMAGEEAYDGPRWKTASPIEVVDQVTVPTFIVGGLLDIFQRGEPLVYERLKTRVPTGCCWGRGPHDRGEGLPATASRGSTRSPRWLDRYLEEVDTDVKTIPKVTQYVSGEEHFATRPTGPSRASHPRACTCAAARSSRQLRRSCPEAPESFLQNPISGVCTQSTSQWSAGLLGPVPCTRDNRLDETNGVHLHHAAARAGPWSCRGQLFASLWVTTTAADAVVSVRATDVAPDGHRPS